MKEPIKAYLQVETKVWRESAERLLKDFRPPAQAIRFEDRGLESVVKALSKSGIDYPERLLFMSDKEISYLPGIGKAALKVIQKYKAKFMK